MEEIIWNRACLDFGGISPAEGDRALAVLLQAHGTVMNGGIVHALGSLSTRELSEAMAAFRYFGLPQAAEVLAQEWDDTEETEERLDRMYEAAVPDDGTIERAFSSKLATCPEAFAPV